MQRNKRFWVFVRRKGFFSVSSCGMTLIELLIAMLVVGLMLGLTVSGLNRVFDADLKDTSKKLAATLRYLSKKAVIDHLYFRVVYDVEKRMYRVEESETPFLIADEKDEEELKKEGEEEKKPASFVASSSRLLSDVRLPGNVFFKDIQVDYKKEKVDTGNAYTYFFPNGYSTMTIVNFRDEDDEVYYSVSSEPLSGHVEVESTYKNMEDFPVEEKTK